MNKGIIGCSLETCCEIKLWICQLSPLLLTPTSPFLICLTTLLPFHVTREICAAFYGRSVDQVLFPACWHDSLRLVKATVITFLFLLEDTVNCLSFFCLDYIKQSWKTGFSSLAHFEFHLNCICETPGGRVCVCVCVCVCTSIFELMERKGQDKMNKLPQ